MPVLVWPVPLNRPHVPFPNPYVLRNWDRIEQLEVPTFGMRYAPKIYWTNPLPINTPGTPCGTADDWQKPLLYSVWVSDGYACNCPPIAFPTGPVYNDGLQLKKAATLQINESENIVPTFSESVDLTKAATLQINESG